MKKEIVKSTILLTTLCFALSQSVFAAENKELVRMDLDQNSDGSVKVNIYTDKPYTEQIIVNKKPDNKYVILLPETVNAMGVKPDVSGLSNVKGVDVKTQQYSSLPNKGYTKITIDGKRPIEVVPQTHVSRTMQAPRRSVAEQTRSVMSQSNRRPYVTPQQVQMTVPQRVLNQSRPVTHSDFVPAYERQRQYNAQNTSRRYSQPTQNYVSRPVQQTRQEVVVSQPQRAVQQFAQSVQRAVQPQVQEQTQLIETTQTSNNALTENEQVALEDNNNNQAVDDATTKQLEANDDDITEDDLAFFKKIIRFKQKVVRKIKQILSFRISFSTFMGLAQFALLIVLVKIIGDLVKRIQYPNGENIETRPVTKRLIHNNDETFDQAYPSYSNMDVYNTSRSNFEEDNKEGFNIKPLSTSSSFAKSNNLYSNENMLYNQQQPASQSFIQHNDFYQPLNKISKEEKMSIFDENAEDIERTIFKNPLKQISKQEEQTLFDEDEPASFNSPFNNQEDYSIKEQEDEFFNYNDNSENDEDFFIFEDDDEDEDEDDIEYQEDYDDEEDDAEYDEDESDEDEYEYEDDGEEYEEADDVEDTEAQPQEPEAVSDPFEHLTVKSKFVIDGNRGFALVSVDGLNALIGYVGSKISVIRKFKEEINDKMQVRLNEQADENTLIYIIRVGKFKTLVEVKPESIRQLLDL